MIKNEKMIQRSFTIPKELLAKIEDDAKKRYVNRSVIVREILISHYEKREENNDD